VSDSDTAVSIVADTDKEMETDVFSDDVDFLLFDKSDDENEMLEFFMNSFTAVEE